jgi:predicted  nucleic acid-binding Zn-ribbon protein
MFWLCVLQRLLEDIKCNKARTEVVLKEHDVLRDRTGETTSSQGNKLLQEIGHLEETAEDQCSELRAAVAEQEEYELEIRQLNTAISEAQQQLQASPVRASTVDALKQQIAEHNVRTCWVTYHLARQTHNYRESFFSDNFLLFIFTFF